MVHSFLASPFADAARTARFAAVRAALQAAAPEVLLLGNLVLEDDATALDAVVVRPHAITLLVFAAGGGRLGVPAPAHGRWLLDGAPLPGPAEFANPLEQFTRQRAALAAWLQPRFTPAQADLSAISGVVLFEEPVVPEPGAEAVLAAAAGFRLLGGAGELPDCLAGLASPAINLTADDLAEWAAEWAAFVAEAPAEPPVARPADVAAVAGRFLREKARALWYWLGAHDLPNDDYSDSANLSARNEQKQHLELLRQQMRADLRSQLQALAAREAERERSIAQLRAALAQAPPVAAQATALVSRLGAETREKAALEAEIRASRAKSEARNRELDAKIQHLSRLIEQLSARPVPDAAAAVPVAPLLAAGKPPLASVRAGAATVVAGLGTLARRARAARADWAPDFLPLRRWRWPRVALLGAGVAALGLGVWGLGHRGSPAPAPFRENGRWGYADAQGQPVVPAQLTAAGPFQERRAVVAKNGAYGFDDQEGAELVAPAYDALHPYAGGYARARVGETYTFLDEDGQEFDHYYFNALDFAEGHAAVLDHRGWYYISGPDEPDEPVIFIRAYSFVDGLARVKLPDGYTYISPGYLDDPGRGTGAFGRYQQATDFASGRARVTQAGRRFFIDKNGAEVK